MYYIKYDIILMKIFYLWFYNSVIIIIMYYIKYIILMKIFYLWFYNSVIILLLIMFIIIIKYNNNVLYKI